MIEALPQRVFDLWTRPEFMVRWMSPYPGNVRCTAEADLRIGGTYKLAMRGDFSACEITGTYVAIEPPRRLVFTWLGPPTGEVETLVTLELRELEGATELVMTHEELPTNEIRDGHRAGWTNMLDHLDAAVR